MSRWGRAELTAGVAVWISILSACTVMSATPDAGVDGGCADGACPPDCTSGPDGDGDGVVDACDVCEGHDDGVDRDGDGVPDGCEASGRFVDNGQYVDFDQGIDVAIGDLDGDGDLDAFVIGDAERADRYGYGRVWLNDGAGNFATTSETVGEFRTQGDVELGDMDGDGDLDALTTDDTSDRTLWLNQGDGTFTESTLSVPSGQPADLDGDGDLDIVAGLYLRGFGVWINDGSGSVAFTAYSSEPDISARRIDVADLDGDGDLDVYAAMQPSSDYYGWPHEVWLNDGTGTFSMASQTPDYGVFALGDLDGDGDIDAYVGHPHLPVPDLARLNDGSGGFTDVAQAPRSQRCWTLELADFDGDGDLDVFESGPEERVLFNDGSAHFTRGPSLGPRFGRGAGVGDFDGDGDPDVFVVATGSGSLYSGRNHVWLNDGAGNLVDPVRALSPMTATGVALGDVDGDGDEDAVVSNGASYLGVPQPTQLFLNDGSGRFVETEAGLGVQGGGVALADLDGDGDLDAVVAGAAGSEDNPLPPTVTRVLLNDGAGRFRDTGQALDGPAWDVRVADLDGDADLDVVVVGSALAAWLNDGAGRFPERVIIADTDRVYQVAIGDLDGNGYVDIVGSEAVYWLNLGSASFVERYLTFGGSSVDLGDLDGDGDLDILLGGVHINHGDGTFMYESCAENCRSLLSGTVTLADVDGDGDLDAFVAQYGNRTGSDAATSGAAVVLLNDGRGTFSDSGQLLGWAHSIGVAMADLNGDGSPDAFVVNNGRDQVWINE